MTNDRYAGVETRLTTRRRDEETVAVRIALDEAGLRKRAKRLGAVWRSAQKVWEMHWADARRFGLTARVASY